MLVIYILLQTGEAAMKIRPYLTFNGTCAEAIGLYKRAFRTDTIKVLTFGELPENPGFSIPDEYKNRIVQATLKLGDDFIRLSDCGPGAKLNDPESERISLAIEADTDEVKHAFGVLAEEGRVGIPLGETFYSPCAGVVFDKFGIMWNFVGQK
jgi:PhnB protein